MLTNDQEYILEKVMDKIGSKKPYFYPDFKCITIGGYAGTGKTFLISILRKEILNKWNDKNVAFACFTGKASSVLKRKLEENNIDLSEDYCGTIHSLIYRPELQYNKKLKKMIIIKWIKKDILDFDLIIIDEASMINKDLWNDLISYNIPIIAVGDHGQLPPIGDNFNLMSNPQYILTEVKRQSLDNPIIRLSQDIRNGKSIPYGFYDDKNKNVFKLNWNSEDCKKTFDKLNFSNFDDTIILCGLNKTRVWINQMIRNRLGFKNQEPYPGERIVFLKNNYNTKILNGMLGNVLFFMYEGKNIYNITVLLDGYSEPFNGLVYNGCFGKEQYDNFYEELQNKRYKEIIKKSNLNSIDVCDWGYCISTHKSQGSEFKRVICFVEKSYYWDDEYMKRWLYTAATRAKEKLFLIT
jgi:exodeoxyribonuclease V